MNVYKILNASRGHVYVRVPQKLKLKVFAAIVRPPELTYRYNSITIYIQ